MPQTFLKVFDSFWAAAGNQTEPEQRLGSRAAPWPPAALGDLRLLPKGLHFAPSLAWRPPTARAGIWSHSLGPTKGRTHGTTVVAPRRVGLAETGSIGICYVKHPWLCRHSEALSLPSPHPGGSLQAPSRCRLSALPQHPAAAARSHAQAGARGPALVRPCPALAAGCWALRAPAAPRETSRPPGQQPEGEPPQASAPAAESSMLRA